MCRVQQPEQTAEPVCLLSQQKVPANSQDLHGDGESLSTSSPCPVRDTPVQPYLPANVSLEEGFCMVRQCRAQMPLLRPEPFYIGPELGDAVGVNVDAIAASAGDDISYTPVQSQGYNTNYHYPQNNHMQTQASYNSYNSIPGPIVSKPLRRRPPAQIYVGRPLRPGNRMTLLFVVDLHLTPFTGC